MMRSVYASRWAAAALAGVSLLAMSLSVAHVASAQNGQGNPRRPNAPQRPGAQPQPGQPGDPGQFAGPDGNPPGLAAPGGFGGQGGPGGFGGPGGPGGFG